MYCKISHLSFKIFQQLRDDVSFRITDLWENHGDHPKEIRDRIHSLSTYILGLQAPPVSISHLSIFTEHESYLYLLNDMRLLMFLYPPALILPHQL